MFEKVMIQIGGNASRKGAIEFQKQREGWRGRLPLISKKCIHTKIHRLHGLHKMLYFTIRSREIGCSKK